MAESDISEFFGLYDELTETDIQAVERFIYAMVAEMFLRSWPEHMNILSVMGAMKQLMAGRYQE